MVSYGQVVLMTNLLEQAINCEDGDLAVKIIQDALGIENADMTKFCFGTTWPADRERRARIIGEWLQAVRVRAEEDTMRF